jgi:hypothetical protein
VARTETDRRQRVGFFIIFVTAVPDTIMALPPLDRFGLCHH